MIHKVSYVAIDGEHPGAIANVEEPPQIGDRVMLGKMEFEIVEILELMPPRGEFHFLHASCRRVDDKS